MSTELRVPADAFTLASESALPSTMRTVRRWLVGG
jgi:hypothetical protein